MSIFDLNGPKKIVANEEIQITEENRYFFPGIIHGGEKYVIQAYGWDVGDRPEDKRVEVKYLYAEDIVELAKRYTWKEGYLNEERFKEGFKVLEEEAESFLVENDGKGGYYTLNQMWEKAEPEDYEKLTKWALKACTKLFGASIYLEAPVILYSSRTLHTYEKIGCDLETHVILYGTRTSNNRFFTALRTFCTFAATFYCFSQRAWREVSCLIGRTALSHLQAGKTAYHLMIVCQIIFVLYNSWTKKEKTHNRSLLD